jgi:hypothetical protein
MISALIVSAKAKASSVLPTAVGPRMITSFGFIYDPGLIERQIAAPSEVLNFPLNHAGMTQSKLVEASRLSEFPMPF